MLKVIKYMHRLFISQTIFAHLQKNVLVLVMGIDIINQHVTRQNLRLTTAKNRIHFTLTS